MIMNKGKVKQWCRDFKNDQTNVHNEELNGRPSIQTYEIVQQVNQGLQRDRLLTDKLRLFGRTTIYTIATEKFRYHILCAK